MKRLSLLLASVIIAGCTPYAQSYQPAVDQQMSPATADARNYDQDLSACREILTGSSLGHDTTTAKGAAIGALGGAGLGLLTGHGILPGIAGAGIGAIAGRYSSDSQIRAALDQCLQARGWTIIGAE